MKISENWTGELVESYLEEVFAIVGRPVQIIRDGGSDLCTGLELLREKFNFVITSDIGHFVANVFKKRFSEIKSYEQFLSFIGGISKKIALTELSHLLPPKLRSKGRFMGISRVVFWAIEILKIYNGEKISYLSHESFQKFKDIFKPLKQLEWAVNKINEEFLAVNLVLEKIKTIGLNKETLDGSRFTLESLGPKSTIKDKIIDYLINAYNDSIFLKIDTILSSDILESLFGKLKYFIKDGPKDIGRLALLLPCICGKRVTVDEVSSAMAKIRLGDIIQWQKEEIGRSLLAKRIEVLGKKEKKSKNDNSEKNDIFGYLPGKCVNSPLPGP